MRGGLGGPEHKMIETENGGVKFFDDWNEVKKGLDERVRVRSIREGEVWWCSVGENICTEINGKGSRFVRPVLVLRKLSKYSFIGVPLTSKSHVGSWYVSFVFQNKEEVAVVAQVRNFSVARLHRKMGTVPQSDLNLVRKGLLGLLK